MSDAKPLTEDEISAMFKPGAFIRVDLDTTKRHVRTIETLRQEREACYRTMKIQSEDIDRLAKENEALKAQIEGIGKAVVDSSNPRTAPPKGK